MLPDDCAAAVVGEAGAVAPEAPVVGVEVELWLLLLHAAKPRAAKQATTPTLEARIGNRTTFMALTSSR
jgi:hypothetical protein